MQSNTLYNVQATAGFPKSKMAFQDRKPFSAVLAYSPCSRQGWRSRGPALVSRPASRPNFNGLGLGLGLGGPGFVYRVSRPNLDGLGLGLGLGHPCLGLGLGLGGPGLDYNPGLKILKNTNTN